MQTPDPKSITPVFAALGDATRMQLVHRLAQGEAQSIVQLADGMDISHQGITKHLKVMEKAGLVRAERVGRERRYTCDPQAMHTASQYLQQVAQDWDAALLRLKAFVEENEADSK